MINDNIQKTANINIIKAGLDFEFSVIYKLRSQNRIAPDKLTKKTYLALIIGTTERVLWKKVKRWKA